MKISSENPGTLFADEIVSRFPGLKSGRVWKEQHDLLLLQAVLRYVFLAPYREIIIPRKEDAPFSRGNNDER